MTGPPCPNCGTLITKVILTLKDQEGIRFIRRRHCQSCDHRFYSAQPLEEVVAVQWNRVNRKPIPKVVGGGAE